MRLRAALAGALVLLGGAPTLHAGPAEAPPCRGVSHDPPEEAALEPDGRLWPFGDGREEGVLSLVQPEFRTAEDLVEGLRSVGFEGLAVDLVSPRVVRDPRPGERGPQSAPGRLLLRGERPIVERARDWLDRLDRPEPSVRLCLALCEIARTGEWQKGAFLRFDKDLGATPQTTLFRGYTVDFRPEDVLRQDVIGLRPFEGTSAAFGEPDWLHGLLEMEISALLADGRGRWLARPHLLLTKGRPAELQVKNLLPQLLFRLPSAGGPQVAVGPLASGLTLKATALDIAPDRATIDLQLVLELPVRIERGDAPPGAYELRTRAVRTQLTLEDRRPLVFGGLVLKGRERSRTSIPAMPVTLDPILGGLAFEGLDRDVWFVATAAIRPAWFDVRTPSHHARRREDRRLARLQREGASASDSGPRAP
ncbi:MAG: hypothetical protein AB7T63_11080 [Planctomycetota bacterium]